MVAMLSGSGLRRAELLTLRPESILGKAHRGRVDERDGHQVRPGVPSDQQNRACLARRDVPQCAVGCCPHRSGSRRDRQAGSARPA
jgi:hypothetical protein